MNQQQKRDQIKWLEKKIDAIDTCIKACVHRPTIREWQLERNLYQDFYKELKGEEYLGKQ